MYKVFITGCDPKLEGYYYTSNQKSDIENKKSIKIYKVLKNGTASKNYDYFPFKSYHNNPKVKEEYKAKNGNAQIKIVEKVDSLELIDNILFYSKIDNSYKLLLNDKEYIIKTASSISPSKKIYVDDESDFYTKRELRTEEAVKRVWMSHYAPDIRIITPKSTSKYLMTYSNGNIEVNDNIFFEIPESQRETLKKVIDIIKPNYENTLLELSNSYERFYKKNISIIGYWANR